MVEARQPAPTSAHLQSSTPEPILWCRPRVVRFESTSRPCLILEPKWEPYDVRKAYERAQHRHDPLLSPHGFFRGLARGNSAHAIEFVKRFGPLVAGVLKRASDPPDASNVLQVGLDPSHPPSEPLVVNLNEFWWSHLEFCQVVSLWESRNDSEALTAAWRAIAKDYPLGPLANFRGVALGILPWDKQRPKGFWKASHPWSMEIFEAWAKSTSFARMRQLALALMRRELNAQAWDSKIVWEYGWEPTGEKFRPTIWQPTLLGTIWEFFGHDTAGTFWRRCPHCQRFFYPKRHDQFYCTPRQQALASKRAYAARRRAEEKKRRKRVRRTRKGAKR